MGVLEDAGLLSKDSLLVGDLMSFAVGDREEHQD